MAGKASREAVELGLGEAVEKEVGGDEVVVAAGLEGEGVDLVGGEVGFDGGVGAFAEEMEHGGAEVDRVGVEERV